MTAVVISNPNRLGYIKLDKKRYTDVRERRRYPRLWAIAGQVPAFSLDFTQRSIVDQINGVQGVFTRPSSTQLAWDGTQFVEYAANQPAWALGPNGLWGLQMAPGATNLYLNSGAPATQSVTVTAAQHTLSFYGTGTLTLSGASTVGPLVGAGAAPTRSSLTFTPSAGSLTLTLSGSISLPQLELGPVATPLIITEGAPATRAADAFVFGPGAAFDSWYNQAGGVVHVAATGVPVSQSAFLLSDGTNNNRIILSLFGGGAIPYFRVVSSGVDQANNGLPGASTPDTVSSLVGVMGVNNFKLSANGAAPAVDTSGTIPVVDRASFAVGTTAPNQTPLVIHRLDYYPPGPAADRIQQLSGAVL